MVEGLVSRKDGTLMVEVTNALVPRIRRGPKGQLVEASSFLKLPRPMFRKLAGNGLYQFWPMNRIGYIEPARLMCCFAPQ